MSPKAPALLTDERIEELAIKSEFWFGSSPNTFRWPAFARAIEAEVRTLAAGEQQPVAWRWRFLAGSDRTWRHAASMPGFDPLIVESEPMYAAPARLPNPHVGEDEHGNATFEWWRGARKLTLYLESDPNEQLLKSWGPNMHSEMVYVPTQDYKAVRAAFEWLAAGEQLEPSKPERDMVLAVLERWKRDDDYTLNMVIAELRAVFVPLLREQGEETAVLPPLPEPDGYCAMTSHGSIVIPPSEFKKYNGYAIFTAAQMLTYARAALAGVGPNEGSAHPVDAASTTLPLDSLASMWISIEDRLPDVKERVMFYRAEGFCFGYRRDDMSTVWMDESYQNADGDATGCWGVTHWMPIPAAPQALPAAAA